MTHVFAPGCALMLYKPSHAEKVLGLLGDRFGEVLLHLTCCHHDPALPFGTTVINTCAGCDRRFRELYEGVSTISLWEVLASDETLSLPDYRGARMAIQDACPTRTEPRVHEAVRRLLGRMNIEVVEPSATRERAVCCGDSFYGELEVEAVKTLMRKRAESMPADDVVVYCVSCVKSTHIGGRTPRHLLDLVLAEQTDPQEFEPDAWHARLEEYIAAH